MSYANKCTNIAGIDGLNTGDGDFELRFDPNKPDEVQKAKETITDMLRRGYAIFIRQGQETLRVRKFDANSPRFFELAEVVGKWVWIRFPETQPNSVTTRLAELGFHWNNSRQTWQHPCGVFRRQAAAFDPRKLYRSYFAADLIRA